MANKIQNNVDSLIPKKFEQGDIFICSSYETFYIMAYIGDHKYTPISLSDGHLWTIPKECPNEAAQGLEFLGRNLKIIFEQ